MIASTPWLLLVLFLASGQLSDLPTTSAPLPPVRRVWLTSEDIPAAWRGTAEHVIVPLEEFEERWRKASASQAPEARLLQAAHHFAVFAGGSLHGCGVWHFQNSRAAEAPFLFPIPLALPGLPRWKAGGRAWINATADGKAWLAVPPGKQSQLELAWSALGQATLAGTHFQLGLPPAPLTTLNLCLPAGWQPVPESVGWVAKPLEGATLNLWQITSDVTRNAGPLSLLLRHGDPPLPNGGLLRLTQRTEMDTSGAAIRLAVTLPFRVATKIPHHWRIAEGFQLREVVAVRPPLGKLPWRLTSGSDSILHVSGLPDRADELLLEFHGRLERPVGNSDQPLACLFPTGTSVWLESHELRPPLGSTLIWLQPKAAPCIPDQERAGDGLREVWSWSRGAVSPDEPAPSVRLHPAAPALGVRVFAHHFLTSGSHRQACDVLWRCQRGIASSVGLMLPADWDVELLSCEPRDRLHTWSQEQAGPAGKEVRIQLARPLAPGEKLLTKLRLTRQSPPALDGGENTLALPCVQPRDALDVETVVGLSLDSAENRAIASQRSPRFGVQWPWGTQAELVLPPTSFPTFSEPPMLPTCGCGRLASGRSSVEIKLRPLAPEQEGRLRLAIDLANRLQLDVELVPIFGWVDRLQLRFSAPPPPLAWQVRAGSARLLTLERIDDQTLQARFDGPVSGPVELRATGVLPADQGIPLPWMTQMGRCSGRLVLPQGRSPREGNLREVTATDPSMREWEFFSDSGQPKLAVVDAPVAPAPALLQIEQAEAWLAVVDDTTLEVQLALRVAANGGAVLSLPAGAQPHLARWQDDQGSPPLELAAGLSLVLPSGNGVLQICWRQPSLPHPRSELKKLLPAALRSTRLAGVWLRLPADRTWDGPGASAISASVAPATLLDRTLMPKTAAGQEYQLRSEATVENLPVLSWRSRRSLLGLFLWLLPLAAALAWLLGQSWPVRCLLFAGLACLGVIFLFTGRWPWLPGVAVPLLLGLSVFLFVSRRQKGWHASAGLGISLLIVSGLHAYGQAEPANPTARTIDVFILPPVQPGGARRCSLPADFWRELGRHSSSPDSASNSRWEDASLDVRVQANRMEWTLNAEVTVLGPNHYMLPIRWTSSRQFSINGQAYSAPPVAEGAPKPPQLPPGKHRIEIRDYQPWADGTETTTLAVPALPTPRLCVRERTAAGIAVRVQAEATSRSVPGPTATLARHGVLDGRVGWKLQAHRTTLPSRPWLAWHELSAEGPSLLLRSRLKSASGSGAGPIHLSIPAPWRLLAVHSVDLRVLPGEAAAVELQPLPDSVGSGEFETRLLLAGPAPGPLPLPGLSNASTHHLLMPSSLGRWYVMEAATADYLPVGLRKAEVTLQSTPTRPGQFETQSDLRLGLDAIESRTSIQWLNLPSPCGSDVELQVSPGMQVQAVDGEGLRSWQQEGDRVKVGISREWQKRPRLLVRGSLPSATPAGLLASWPVHGVWFTGSWLLAAGRQGTLSLDSAPSSLVRQPTPLGGPLFISQGPPPAVRLASKFLEPRAASVGFTRQTLPGRREKLQWLLRSPTGPSAAVRVKLGNWPPGYPPPRGDAEGWSSLVEQREGKNLELLLIANRPRSEWRLELTLDGPSTEVQPSVTDAWMVAVPAIPEM